MPPFGKVSVLFVFIVFSSPVSAVMSDAKVIELIQSNMTEMRTLVGGVRTDVGGLGTKLDGMSAELISFGKTVNDLTRRMSEFEQKSISTEAAIVDLVRKLDAQTARIEMIEGNTPLMDEGFGGVGPTLATVKADVVSTMDTKFGEMMVKIEEKLQENRNLCTMPRPMSSAGFGCKHEHCHLSEAGC